MIICKNCDSKNIDEIKPGVFRCLSCSATTPVETLNPSESDIEIFDKCYHCWRDKDYIGMAKFVDDENVGPSFIKMAVSKSGELIHEVLLPTKYLLCQQ